MTRGLSQVAVGGALARRRVAAVLAMPLGGCGTVSALGQVLGKDETFVDEPADKLYNEGLYLLNKQGSDKAAAKNFEEVDRQHPYSDWARKSLMMSAYAYYEAAIMTAASVPRGATSRCIRAARTRPTRST